MTDTDFYVLPRIVDSVLANGRPDPWLIRPRNPGNLTAAASDEWRFGLDTWSLTGIVNRTLLTMNSEEPTFDRATMTMLAGTNQGLLTPYDEVASETHCWVFRNSYVGTGNMMIGGTMSSIVAEGGWSIFQNAPNVLSFQTRGIPTGAGAIVTVSLATVPAGAGVFVGISHTSTTRLSYVGGLLSDTKTGTHTLSTPVRKVSVGAVHLASFTKPPSICSYMYIPAAKTSADMDGYYLSAKAFMRSRGVPMF